MQRGFCKVLPNWLGLTLFNRSKQQLATLEEFDDEAAYLVGFAEWIDLVNVELSTDVANNTKQELLLNLNPSPYKCIRLIFLCSIGSLHLV